MMDSENLALAAMFAAGICGLLGLILPWLGLLVSRTTAAVTAGAFATLGTVALLISNAYMPAKYNIRIDLLILPPLLLAVWLICIGLTVWTIMRRTAVSSGAESSGAR